MKTALRKLPRKQISVFRAAALAVLLSPFVSAAGQTTQSIPVPASSVAGSARATVSVVMPDLSGYTPTSKLPQIIKQYSGGGLPWTSYFIGQCQWLSGNYTLQVCIDGNANVSITPLGSPFGAFNVGTPYLNAIMQWQFTAATAGVDQATFNAQMGSGWTVTPWSLLAHETVTAVIIQPSLTGYANGAPAGWTAYFAPAGASTPLCNPQTDTQACS